MDIKGKKVNFLGDSITEGVGASAQEYRYTSVFERITGAEVRNYGISGTRYAKQTKPYNEYFDANDFCKRYVNMSDDADIVVVFGSTNDYGHGDAPMGEASDRTPDTFIGATHYLMRGLIEKYPTSTIVFLTPMHRENENVPNQNGYILKQYVDVIKEVAELYSIPVLDTFATLGVNPDIPVQKAAFCPDGLHPNNAGHKKLAERIKAFIETL